MPLPINTSINHSLNPHSIPNNHQLIPTSQARTFDVVTLFHKPSVPASQRTLNLLKVAHATATETTTIDQASDNTAQALRERGEFELEVTEEPPTPDQLRSILDYAARADPKQSISDIVRGAKDAEDALKKVKENGDNFIRPVVSAECFLCFELFFFALLLNWVMVCDRGHFC